MGELFSAAVAETLKSCQELNSAGSLSLTPVTPMTITDIWINDKLFSLRAQA